MRKKNDGYTLVELSFVTLVALAIILAGFHRYQTIQFKKQMTVMHGSVKGLADGLNNYYYAHCHDLTDVPLYPESIPSEDLKPYLLGPDIIQNPFSVKSGLDAYRAYVDVRAPTPMLRIETSFPNSFSLSVLETYLSVLHAAGIGDDPAYTLWWEKSPSFISVARRLTDNNVLTHFAKENEPYANDPRLPDYLQSPCL